MDIGLGKDRDGALLLRAEDCARLTNLGRTTIFDLIGAGQLPVVRVGRAVRVPRAGLEEWIERRTERSSPAVGGGEGRAA
jgi:excisionase family DNA binding protein